MNDECPICLEHIPDDTNRASTSCGHQFHTGCLCKSVLKRNLRCPMCRSAIVDAGDVQSTAQSSHTAIIVISSNQPRPAVFSDFRFLNNATNDAHQTRRYRPYLPRFMDRVGMGSRSGLSLAIPLYGGRLPCTLQFPVVKI